MTQARVSERGLALVSVLWGLSILSLVSAAMISMERFSSRAEENVEVQIAARGLADAALMRAVLSLSAPRVSMRWPSDGTGSLFTYGNVAMRVAIRDESGKIDLNAANVSLLAGLFQSQGVSANQAASLANRILDWRDTSGLHSLDGDRSDLSSARVYKPRRGPFQSVDELQLIPGISSELFTRIEPVLTVYSQRATIDFQTASREAMLAIPGMDEDKIASTIALRASDPISRGGAAAVGIVDPTTSAAGRAFTITVDFDYRERHYGRKTIVRITQDPLRPYLLLAAN